ncbi:MAG: hypothetical protein ACR2QF_01270 [Geminicoccaceae bacterium]
MTEKDDQAKPKSHGSLNMDFFDEVDGWRGFIASIPGKAFDGVDIEATTLSEAREGKIQIAAAYAVDANGGERKRYTAETRKEIEDIVEARSAAQFPATAEEKAA